MTLENDLLSALYAAYTPQYYASISNTAQHSIGGEKVSFIHIIPLFHGLQANVY